MKKYKCLSSLFLILILVFLSPLCVSANSSWRWISETRPFDILPFVVVITLAIETLSIYYIGNVKKLAKILFFVIIANALSFAAPYLIANIDPIYSFKQLLDHIPIYTVGTEYLVLTLIIEVPCVYFTLRNSVENKTKLFLTIIGANVATTGITALAERIFCHGSW